MHLLNILHVQNEQFQLQRIQANAGSLVTDTAHQSVNIPSPYTLPDKGKVGLSLMQGLQWYLEEFLSYPFSPDTDVAEKTWQGLEEWGAQAYEALFGSAQCGTWLSEALKEEQGNIHLRISSNDPGVLSWPWEALQHPAKGVIGHLGCIDRRLNADTTPAVLPESLPKDRVNILLVTPRPYERDVQYRAVSRHLVELLAKDNLPANIHLLRPPTFEQLKRHLDDQIGFYHILHFDGHGAYGTGEEVGSAYIYSGGHKGHLVFENENGTADPIPADELSVLLQDHALPAVVLNACQSAMIDQKAGDPFSSVATALLKAGVRSVVAMAYSLYVSGAQEFLPAFYRCLFTKGDITEAVRVGRMKMFQQPRRVCRRGRHPLSDWLVPVVYQQSHFELPFARQDYQPEQGTRTQLPPEAEEKDRYGFIGRDGPAHGPGAQPAKSPAGGFAARPGRGGQDFPGPRVRQMAGRHPGTGIRMSVDPFQ